MRSKAFTLLEVLLVTLVLSAVLAISVPNFSPVFKRIELKQAAQDLAYVMRYAQSRAVTYNAVVRLEFSSDHRSYWLTQEAKTSGLGADDGTGAAVSGGFPGAGDAGDDTGSSGLSGDDMANSDGGFERVSGRYGKTYRIPGLIMVESEEDTVDFFPDGSIQKQQLSLCNEKQCYDISTKQRRGYVYVYGYAKDA